MRHLTRNICISLALLLLCAWAIYPPERSLRLGKDLAGGVSLVYGVDLGPNDTPDIVGRTIEVLKDRINPRGTLDISFIQQGRDRIEISMPLPDAKTLERRDAFKAELRKLEDFDIDLPAFERAMRLTGADREAALRALYQTNGPDGRAAESAPRKALIEPLLAAIRSADEARRAFETPPAGPMRPDDASALEAAAADAAIKLDETRNRVLASVVTPEAMRTALEESDDAPKIRDSATNEIVSLDSPRGQALKNIRSKIGDLPGGAALLDAIEARHKDYVALRKGLDDPADLERLLRGSGVLEFRIALRPGEVSGGAAEEARLRRQLQERGPDGVEAKGVKWFQVNKISNWFNDSRGLEFLRADPAAFFAQSHALVGDFHAGRYYVLLYDEPGLRLTQAEGAWSLTSAGRTVDQNSGFPAVNFAMNPKGAQLLGDLTERNVNRPMAIVLDGQVYSAPNINSRISNSGIIVGRFSDAELNYLIKTLSAGALAAKLGDRPISANTLAPELGSDNLTKGLHASLIALAIVGVFMIGYYFMMGTIAMVALLGNAIIILGTMSLVEASFTLPGIAGIILTFGTAVDSNVLIYERIREELNAGNDLRTSVRLAFQRVLSTIIDSNLSNLIVCVVLAYTATSEIRGFAITLGIGVVGTMISALLFTRIIFVLLIENAGIRTMRQLPIVWPGLQRALTPNVDWIALRWLFIPLSCVMVSAGLFLMWRQGEEILNTEFRGGSAITLQLKDVEKGGVKQPLTLTRGEVDARITRSPDGIAYAAERRAAELQQRLAGMPAGPERDAVERALASERALVDLKNAEVVAINPAADGVTSDRFTIKTTITDSEALKRAITDRFKDEVDSVPALAFRASEFEGVDAAPVFKILDAKLGKNIGREEFSEDVSSYINGVAIVLQDITPRVDERTLTQRLNFMRTQPDKAGFALKREFRVVVPEVYPGTRDVKTAVIVVRDPGITIYDETRWKRDLAASEWTIVREALTVPTTLASISTFSPAVAADFRAKAIVAVVLSLLLIMMYIWVRFGSVRYSLAAVIPLAHDTVVVLAFIGMSKWIYQNIPGAAYLGIRPFKIDLELVAAILTIIGYSLNDSVVILDRIRENRGKLAFTTRKMANDAVNQTLSRTAITGGTTLISVIVLFLYGGEGVTSFAYTMIIGTIVGTYSSWAITALIAFDRKSPPPSSSVARSERSAESDRALVPSA
ncbi:MAG: protein translocase subunit SecD [Phycisphaerales bacterium]|nr:protein translocase subunit SecD [Phycisphaerales bacterium]